MFAQRSDVGAVGAKLYYPDNAIQHAGVVLGIGGVAGHGHKNLPRESNGYVGRLAIAQNYSCVTAACMLMRRQVWDAVGGLDEDFQVVFNDVDLCMTLEEAGYRNVVINSYFAYHYESASRGPELSAEKQKRLAVELGILKKKHPVFADYDPYYPAELNRDEASAMIAPGYLSASNALQPSAWRPWKKKRRGIRVYISLRHPPLLFSGSIIS